MLENDAAAVVTIKTNYPFSILPRDKAG
jgi:hypothetical protein